VPPFGEIWLAYSSTDAVRRWLARGLSEGTPGERARRTDELKETEQHLHDALRQIRERGFAVKLSSPRLDEVQAEVLGGNARGDLRERVARIAATLDSYELLGESPDEIYTPKMIIAPVFGPDTSVVFAITLTGLKAATGAEIESMASSVVETGLSLTRAIGGRAPAGDRVYDAS
jgi:DNA-binding IclR family transcriptional regulator